MTSPASWTSDDEASGNNCTCTYIATGKIVLRVTAMVSIAYLGPIVVYMIAMTFVHKTLSMTGKNHAGLPGQLGKTKRSQTSGFKLSEMPCCM